MARVSAQVQHLTLYLDTHPNCKNGLTLFHELLKKRLDMLADFADRFYPSKPAVFASSGVKFLVSW